MKNKLQAALYYVGYITGWNNISIWWLFDRYTYDWSTFPPIIWALNKIEGKRKTNASKSFQAKFNSNFCMPSPNTYTFVTIIKQI